MCNAPVSHPPIEPLSFLEKERSIFMRPKIHEPGLNGTATMQAAGYVEGLPTDVNFAPLGAGPLGDSMMGLPRQDSSGAVAMNMAAQPALGMPTQSDVKAENFDDMMNILFSVRGSPA